ncbi:MAG: hypothetical protein II480_11945, partial [Bacteroidales bacterium]|nr:hypothetical protein [Bacteroidales bacterium]
MKLAKIILTSAVAIMAAACSNPLEHQVMGKWTLQECEIDRIDSVCQARVEQSIASTKKAIDLLHHELDSTKVEAKKQELLAYEQELQSQLESYTPQKFKDEYNTLSKAQIGSMTITFK